MVEDAEVRANLARSQDELLIELGTAVGLFQAPPPDKLAKREAQEWLWRSRDRIASAVCTPAVREVLDKDVFELAKHVAIAIDAAGLNGAALIAVLVVRIGIKQVCGWA